ncbi:MAG: GNAT family N-acetyltransferase [Bacillota bacterium]
MRGLLLGQRIRLTALRDSDNEAIETWFSNVRFLRYYDMLPAIPQSAKQIETLFKEFEDAQDKLMFAIRMINDDKIIGVTGYYDILWTNGVATTFIGIGDSGSAGQGYGKEAMQQLLDFGFNELNFHRIELTTIAYNQPAIKLYEGLGFVREGAHREFILRDGQRFDLYLYGLLDTEWRSKHGLTQGQ